MEKFRTYLDKYFWHFIFWIGMLNLILGYFTGHLTEVEKAYHGVVSFIALAVIDIRRWLAAKKC